MWTAGLDTNGYGAYWDAGKTLRAHRASYLALVGPIPEGLQLDHLCRVRNCVNPAHLEPVTSKENCRRGETGIVSGRLQREKTQCPHGHPYNEKNTQLRFLDNGQQKRDCRECNRLRCQRWRIRQRKRRPAVQLSLF